MAVLLVEHQGEVERCHTPLSVSRLLPAHEKECRSKELLCHTRIALLP